MRSPEDFAGGEEALSGPASTHDLRRYLAAQVALAEALFARSAAAQADVEPGENARQTAMRFWTEAGYARRFADLVRAREQRSAREPWPTIEELEAGDPPAMAA